jgi:hypothetical protein
MNWRQTLTSLLVNIVPAAGWFLGDWSQGTTLAVYWFENLGIALFLAVQILIHRRFNKVKGHFNYTPPASDRVSAKTYLEGYLLRALVFIFAHGLFLSFLLLFALPHQFGPAAGVNFRAFGFGCVTVLFFLLLDFIGSVPRLRHSPFRWLEEAGTRSFARIVLVQLVIIGGMFLVQFTHSPRAMFGLFVGLKTLMDLSSLVPQYQPKEPPAWLARTMDKVKSPQHPESFATYWKKGDEDEKKRQARNEEPV